MKTAMQVKNLQERKGILTNDEYAKGYDGALSDCISVAESLLEKKTKLITLIVMVDFQ
jgi:hypothetical protein